jgi:hypothetical protein
MNTIRSRTQFYAIIYGFIGIMLIASNPISPLVKIIISIISILERLFLLSDQDPKVETRFPHIAARKTRTAGQGMRLKARIVKLLLEMRCLQREARD